MTGDAWLVLLLLFGAVFGGFWALLMLLEAFKQWLFKNDD